MRTVEMVTISRPARAERGQAIVELALTLPLLLLIVLGVFDFGLMFQRYEVVTNAAREGARVGVLPDFTIGLPVGARVPLAEQRAQDYLRVGGVTGATVTATIGQSTITGSSPAKTVKEVQVVVQYSHVHVFVRPIAALFGNTMGATMLTGRSAMRMEAN